MVVLDGNTTFVTGAQLRLKDGQDVNPPLLAQADLDLSRQRPAGERVPGLERP